MITTTTETQQDGVFFSLMVILISNVPREKQNMGHHPDPGMQIYIFFISIICLESLSTFASICIFFWLFSDEHFKLLLIFQAEMLIISAFSKALKPGFGFILYH